MFWKKANQEVEQLRKQVEKDAREREAAKLDLQRSLKRLARAIDEIPLDRGLASLGSDLAGGKK